MARMRERRRRGIAIAKVRLGPIEQRALIALGYLEADLAGDKGPAFDRAAEAYLSDKAGRGIRVSAPCYFATGYLLRRNAGARYP